VESLNSASTPFIAVARESVNVEAAPFDRRVVNLEVAGMDNDAERVRTASATQSTVLCVTGNELDFVLAKLDTAAGHHFAQRGGFEQAGFGLAAFLTSASVKRVP
jgi:hypothetical protein